MDLESVHDDDHVVALYSERGLWGGIAKSNFAGALSARRSTARCANWR